MTTKKVLAGFLSVALVLPSNAATNPSGTVTGVVSVSGHRLEGLSVTLVNVETGRSYVVRSGADGSFSATLPLGSYVVSSPGRAGMSISRAPLSIDVVSGRVASANIEMSVLSVQTLTTPGGSATIKHDPPNCITEGEFTLVEATFEPLSSVVNGRLYFQSNLSPEWFYTEFEKIEPPVPGGPSHRAFIPKVNKDGGIVSINIYLQVTSSDFAETKSLEYTVKVVSNAGECQGKLAPIGHPEGAVSVLSASGTAAGGLAGFGGVAGAATIGGLAIAGIIIAVVGGGFAINAATNGNNPEPTPAATVAVPTPTPPVPTPTPAATCTVVLNVTPDVAAPVGLTGKLCAITAAGSTGGSRTLSLPCTTNFVAFAEVKPESSLSGAGPKPADWSGACNQNAINSPCVVNPLSASGAATINLTLTCRQ